MAIFVRNQRSLDSSVTTSQFTSRHLVLLRELFLAGRWTQSAISNGATWDANIVLNPTDLSVNPASPGVITSAGAADFTGYEGYAITLMGGSGDYDNNRGVYRIAAVLTTTSVLVEYPPPDNWTADTGMTGRVFNWGAGSLLGGAEYVVMDPPTGNNQAFLSKPAGDYTFEIASHPLGDYPLHQTNLYSFSMSSADRRARWNAYFDGATAFIFFRTDSGAVWWSMLFGELEGVVSQDLYPGFVSYGTGGSAFDIPDGGGLSLLAMLSDNVGTNQVNGQVTAVCETSVARGSRQQLKSLCRTVKGKAQLVQPWVYMEGVNGGYYRGKHPFRTTNEYWETWRPMDAGESWMHYSDGGVFPKNGPNDLRPIANAG